MKIAMKSIQDIYRALGSSDKSIKLAAMDAA